MNLINEVNQLLEKEFKPGVIKINGIEGHHPHDLTNTHSHLELFIASDKFEGLMLREQHQMVMNVLTGLLQSKLHAVKIKTMTHKKYLESLKQ